MILYILLSGVPPFWGETEQQIFEAVGKGDIDFASDPWPHVSSEAKDCVRAMLQAVRAAPWLLLLRPLQQLQPRPPAPCTACSKQSLLVTAVLPAGSSWSHRCWAALRNRRGLMGRLPIL